MIGDQLQKAIYAALMADPPLCDGKVYDTVPPDVVEPYIHIGTAQILDDGDTCADGWECYTDIDIWSVPETGSKIEVMQIGAQVVPRLLAIGVMTDFTVVVSAVENVRYLDDPDGVTKHGVITMRHVLMPTA